MNRGFKIYYKEAIKTSFKALRNVKNLLKIYFYGLIYLLGRILAFVFGPIFMLSDVKVTKMIRGGKRVSISESFETSDNPKSFWTMLLTWIISSMMLLSGIVLIGAIGFIFELTTSYIMYLTQVNYDVQNIVLIVFAVPFVILLLVFLVEFFMYVSPRNYTVDSIKDLGASQCLKRCISAIKEEGKLTLFTNFIVFFLINAAYIGLATVCIMLSFDSYYAIGADITYPVIILFVLVYLYFAPTFLYAYKCTKISLFEDLMLDKVSVNNSVKGVYVRHARTKKMTIQSYRDNLVRLFDETSDIDTSKNMVEVDQKVEEKTEEVETKPSKKNKINLGVKISALKDSLNSKLNSLKNEMKDKKEAKKLVSKDPKNKESKPVEVEEETSQIEEEVAPKEEEEVKVSENLEKAETIQESEEKPVDQESDDNIEKIVEKVEKDDSNGIELNNDETLVNQEETVTNNNEENLTSSIDDGIKEVPSQEENVDSQEEVKIEEKIDSQEETKTEEIVEPKEETKAKAKTKTKTKKKENKSEDGE